MFSNRSRNSQINIIKKRKTKTKNPAGPWRFNRCTPRSLGLGLFYEGRGKLNSLACVRWLVKRVFIFPDLTFQKTIRMYPPVNRDQSMKGLSSKPRLQCKSFASGDIWARRTYSFRHTSGDQDAVRDYNKPQSEKSQWKLLFLEWSQPNWRKESHTLLEKKKINPSMLLGSGREKKCLVMV